MVAFSTYYRFIQVVLIIGYIVCVVVLNYKNTELFTVCIFAAMFGLLLMALISQELYRLDRVKQNGTIPLAFTMFGIFGALITWYGDKTHYMNRDDPQWSYINIGASAGLVLFAALLTIDWIAGGCKCCSCCCGACVRCCGTHDEDDEDADEE